MKIKVKMKNRLYHSYDINKTRARYGNKYTKYKMCFIMMMVMCNKQHLSNISTCSTEKYYDYRNS